MQITEGAEQFCGTNFIFVFFKEYVNQHQQKCIWLNQYQSMQVFLNSKKLSNKQVQVPCLSVGIIY